MGSTTSQLFVWDDKIVRDESQIQLLKDTDLDTYEDITAMYKLLAKEDESQSRLELRNNTNRETFTTFFCREGHAVRIEDGVAHVEHNREQKERNRDNIQAAAIEYTANVAREKTQAKVLKSIDTVTHNEIVSIFLSVRHYVEEPNFKGHEIRYHVNSEGADIQWIQWFFTGQGYTVKVENRVMYISW